MLPSIFSENLFDDFFNEMCIRDRTINEILDSALRLLEDTIDIDGDQLSLR